MNRRARRWATLRRPWLRWRQVAALPGIRWPAVLDPAARITEWPPERPRCAHCGSPDHAAEACGEQCLEIHRPAAAGGLVRLCGLRVGHEGRCDYTVRAIACASESGTDHLSRLIAESAPPASAQPLLDDPESA